MNKPLKSIILAAEFAAIIAVLSQFTIPLGLIPLTGQTFAVGLGATILGKRISTFAVLIYLLLGFIGLPVFAGMSSGIGVLFGPTGGYLFGFIFHTWITGWILEKKEVNYQWALIGNLVGAGVPLFIGTLWLKVSAELTFSVAFNSGFFPFLIPGALKAGAAAYAGILIRTRLAKRLKSVR